MKIAIDTGHCLSGFDTGAQGCGYKEEDLDRRVGFKVIEKLKALGHTVIHVSPNSSSSLRESLNIRTSRANSAGVDFFLSIHLNCGGGYGTEIFTYGGKRTSKAQSILNNIVSLGYKNRGIKDGSHLAVVRNTHAEACLLEVCFIDSKSDICKFMNLGADKIADAIVKGITGKTISVTNNVSTSSVSSSSSSSYSTPLWKQCINGDVVRRLQHELNIQFNAGLKEDGWFGDNTLNKCITVRRNAHGNISKIIQERLIANGSKVIEANGDFQDRTYAELRQFQKRKGLTIDGICGRNTWRELFKK